MLFQRRTTFLGHEISHEGITSSVEKVEAVEKFATPTSVKNVRQFLGLTSYYRKFIDGYATIAGPLYLLLEGKTVRTKTGKIKAFQGCIKNKWTPECENSFIALKKALMTSPVLRWPDFNHPFVLTPDASAFAIGGVIEQDVDGQGLRPVVYESRKMQPPEKKYPVHEQELLANSPYAQKIQTYLARKQDDSENRSCPTEISENSTKSQPTTAALVGISRSFRHGYHPNSRDPEYSGRRSQQRRTPSGSGPNSRYGRRIGFERAN
jgi:hypothetical protein